jgi:uncharacterized protein with HEPN domain
VPSKDPIQRFGDILINISRIEEYTAGLEDLSALGENPLVYDAVERCLERISEAAKKLGDDAERLCPEVLWAPIRSLGNVLRHEYDRIEPFRVGYMVQDDLPRLRAAVQEALRRFQGGGPL